MDRVYINLDAELVRDGSLNDEDNPNAELIRRMPKNSAPDWEAFRESQREQDESFAEMLRDFERKYDDPKLTRAEREEAGRNLYHWQWVINWHEYRGRLTGRFKA